MRPPSKRPEPTQVKSRIERTIPRLEARIDLGPTVRNRVPSNWVCSAERLFRVFDKSLRRTYGGRRLKQMSRRQWTHRLTFANSASLHSLRVRLFPSQDCFGRSSFAGRARPNPSKMSDIQSGAGSRQTGFLVHRRLAIMRR